MSSIPVQTLREMGKDDTIINQAIDRWRSNRQQTGKYFIQIFKSQEKFSTMSIQFAPLPISTLIVRSN